MRGMILYDLKDADKNSWFIRRLQEEGARHGHLLSLYIAENKQEEINHSAADFCINRSRHAAFSTLFENAGKLSVNNSHTIRIANDKWQSFQLFQGLSLPCMPTFLPGNEPAFPFVAKSRSGHGGSEVFLVEDAQSYADVKKLLKDCPYILQPLCDEPGVDVRAYVMGENVFAAVKRTCKTDFRSNYSLGGQVELFAVTPDQLSAIRILQKELNSDYIGVDFIRNKGQWVVNEIEDAAGARMLYSLTDIDFIHLYWQQIEKRLKEGNVCG